jgi:5'-nucleotidase
LKIAISVVKDTHTEIVREIKEWQAIMDYLRGLPAGSPNELPVIPVDEKPSEICCKKAS